MNQNSDVTKDIQCLNQTETFERLCRAIPLTEMVMVYWSDRSSTHSHRIIAEAILWHGGEGQAAKNAFIDLDKLERDALVAFVKSL
jgi:CxxC motif-containing protein (DUF1111 family)